MARWKQTLTCSNCKHSNWREIECDDLIELPDTSDLRRLAFCSQCGGKAFDIAQEKRPPRHFDQMQPGGLRWGLVDFKSAPARDAEIELDRLLLTKVWSRYSYFSPYTFDPAPFLPGLAPSSAPERASFGERSEDRSQDPQP